MFRILQTAVFAYVIGWDLIHNKSYQSFEPVSSTITTKVKGLGFINKPDNYSSDANFRLFDTADYVIPPAEYNSVGLDVKRINCGITRQSQGHCPEDYTKSAYRCKSDFECFNKNISLNSWNGIPTGKCLNVTYDNQTFGVCEVSAWCPVEIDSIRTNQNIIKNVLNYTIFIKNEVHFKRYEKRRRNILPYMTNEYISLCNNSPDEDPYCPTFRINGILAAAESNPEERKLMLEYGGVIQIEINWECDLDRDIKNCLPKYSFERFDTEFKQRSAASGFNFRYADKYEKNGIIYRNLIKAYGLRFIIKTTGRAGKFDFVPLFLTIGSGIGLLAIPTLISDFVLLNLTPKRKFYQKLKEYDFKTPVKSYSSTETNERF